jgi:hypothetical protein
MKYIKNHANDINILLNPNPIINGSFPNFDLENLDLTTILLQTGYLTIKNEDYIMVNYQSTP